MKVPSSERNKTLRAEAPPPDPHRDYILLNTREPNQWDPHREGFDLLENHNVAPDWVKTAPMILPTQHHK
ncbi:MAG: hypothetical protein ACI915_002753 [Gammaproteobacteria bacterium]|jgi:hypothetical protein